MDGRAASDLQLQTNLLFSGATRAFLRGIPYGKLQKMQCDVELLRDSCDLENWEELLKVPLPCAKIWCGAGWFIPRDSYDKHPFLKQIDVTLERAAYSQLQNFLSVDSMPTYSFEFVRKCVARVNIELTQAPSDWNFYVPVESELYCASVSIEEKDFAESRGPFVLNQSCSPMIEYRVAGLYLRRVIHQIVVQY